MTAKAFDELSERMLWKFMEVNPDIATIFGMHEPFDRHLPDGSFQKIADNLDILTSWTAEAEEIAARNGLSKDQNISLDVLKFTLENYRFGVDDYPLWKMRPEALEHPGTAMLVLLVRDYAPLRTRLDAMADRLNEMPRYLEQFRGRFSGNRPVKIWTEFALEASRAFPSFLESVETLSRMHQDLKAHNKMASSIAATKDELRNHTAWLEKMLDSTTDDFSMGSEKFAKLMRIRGIPFSPEKLLDLATSYLKEYKTRRQTIGAKISGGGGVEQARKITEAEHPRNMDEAVEMTKKAVAEAEEFVVRNDLVSMPVESKVHVMRTPGFLGGNTPGASTYLPAVFEKSQETLFLVSGRDEPDSIGRTYNNYMIYGTAVHETYPGHHHQGVMSNRRPWMHQLPHIVYTPETVSPPYDSQEGWATYCEHIMEEKGFIGSDRQMLTELDYAIWTACRVFSDVRLSRGDVTIEEAVDFAVMESGYSRDFAEADIKGFTYVPGYGMCYLVGRHLVNKLKKDLQESLGPKFSEKRFHDLVAENGNLPFYLLEAEVRDGMVMKDQTGETGPPLTPSDKGERINYHTR
jgi:uncharacterized protein (DUF885 family)